MKNKSKVKNILIISSLLINIILIGLILYIVNIKITFMNYDDTDRTYNSYSERIFTIITRNGEE